MAPEAVYDSLSIGIKLQNYFEDFAKGEVQLFCYLSCLLSLYDGNATAFWEYSFIKNELGSPYSNELETALNSLVDIGCLEKNNEEFYKLSTQGSLMFNYYSNLHQNRDRERYLSSACDSLSTVPFGEIREAINNEPILKQSRKIDDKRILNDAESAIIQVLYSQFGNLKTALQDRYKDLSIPAIVWMKYLVKQLPENPLSEK